MINSYQNKKPKSPKVIYVTLIMVFVLSVGAAVFFAYRDLRIVSTPEAAWVIDEIGEIDDLEYVPLPILPHYESEPEIIPIEPEMPPAVRQEFLDLRAAFNNNDIVGRLWIEGTAIDYLVVQSEDNEFYLYHDIYRNPSAAGWIFLDYDVDLTHENHNIVIYGHNMRTGNMFHNLRFFASYNFFRQNSIINFSTIYEDTQWKIFAFYSAHISFPYTHINYENEEQWAFMLEQFVAASKIDTGIILTPNDRIITLSTCSAVDVDIRYVLQAKLIL